jgi:CHAD domain-containing protein
MSSSAYRLKSKEEPAEGIRRIALGRAEKAQEELPAIEDADFPEAIHAARKDLKKLRAVLRLVRSELGDDLYRAESQRYRRAGRHLAGSRDAEVKVATLAALQEHFGEDLPAGPSGYWRSLLEHERDEMVHASKAETVARIELAAADIEAGIEEISRWPLADDSWGLLSTGFLRSYRRGREAMKLTLADPSADSVHAWRKRTKDLWYQLRILRGAWPGQIGELADQAHELADRLGDHHDLAVLREDLATRGSIGESGAIDELIGRGQDQLLDEALEVGVRLFAEKPKAFRRRFKAYWLAWRPPAEAGSA